MGTWGDSGQPGSNNGKRTEAAVRRTGIGDQEDTGRGCGDRPVQGLEPESPAKHALSLLESKMEAGLCSGRDSE